VTSYTITITADDTDHATTLRLDTSNGQSTLTGLHLHAPTGLSTGTIPAIDYALLLRAVTTDTPTPVSVEPASAGGDSTRTRRSKVPAPAAARGRRVPAETSQSATAPAGVPHNTTTGGTRARRATGAGGNAATGRKTPATPAKAGKTAVQATRTGTKPSRAYRRMPEDLAVAYRQTSSPTALADLYQVPRHTIDGWLRRLRRQDSTSATR